MIVVTPDQLRRETLHALIEEFVTRDGTVQGHADTPLDAMIEDVRAQLKTGKVVIVFDEETESCSIVTKEQLNVGL